MNKQNLPPTQDHINVEKIKNDLVILKNGTVALVVGTSAVNFDLLSEPEQDAKIMAFAQLLNSLTHSFQILIRTKKVDITGYLDYLEQFEQKQLTPGLRRQMAIYKKFVRNLIVRNEILDKSFYIVIPYRAPVLKKTDPKKQFFGKEEKITNLDKITEQAASYLAPKRDHIIKQLSRMSLSAHQLETKELMELFFEIYNPNSPVVADESQSPVTDPSIATRYKDDAADSEASRANPNQSNDTLPSDTANKSQGSQEETDNNQNSNSSPNDNA
jgi:hypothetical protein